jgi:hypothetical protein
MKEGPVMDNARMMAGNGPEMRREKNGWCFLVEKRASQLTGISVGVYRRLSVVGSWPRRYRVHGAWAWWE